MTKFAIGVAVTTEVPSVTVDAGLAVGSHRFRLQVVDSAGNPSEPTEAVVRIRVRLVGPLIRPTPVDPVIPSPTVIRRNK